MDFHELDDIISRSHKFWERKPGTKSYNTLCFNLLNYLNISLGIEICYINEKYFNSTFLSSEVSGHSTLNNDDKIADNCAFILRYKSTNLVFSFGHQNKKNLQKLSGHIYKIDNNNYKNLHIIIFRNEQELNEARKLSNANVYKRSFFTSFDKICTKVLEIDKVNYEKTFSTKWKYIKSTDKPENEEILPDMVNLHNSVIVDNIPVGEESSKLYKLTFITEDTIDILPGQFIMIDTLKERQKEILKSYQPREIGSVSNVTPDIHNDLGTKPISYLKRPFGIFRTYYENFSNDYLSKLDLERTLATILYTVKPNKFEILYKVLEGGVGTNELTKIAKEDKIEILAPLGSVFDLRELLKEDFDEIHIVGGGVGMAPLVYLIQALRYFNHKVKAFIGIEKYSSLAYNDVNENSFTGTGKNAKIYVDDLIMLGLSENSDIYVSIQDDKGEKQKIDIKNVFMGSMVTGPYEEYLKNHNKLNVVTFTCGPLPMMHKVHDITSRYNIKSYVLMEKRMACGIGVCFSCVCQTIVNGVKHNSRVCIDGPIIESKQINWNE
jgi:dihydroorotate dehydrogenase electron transfer subunit